MKTTRMLKLKNTDVNFKVRLDNPMREFCAAKRYAYNRLLEGLTQNGTNKLIQQTFQLNKRYAEDAALQANMIINSQKELLPSYLEEVHRKIKKTEKAIKYFKSVIKKIISFKHHHDWALWNIANKFLEFRLDSHKLIVKEVRT